MAINIPEMIAFQKRKIKFFGNNSEKMQLTIQITNSKYQQNEK